MLDSEAIWKALRVGLRQAAGREDTRSAGCIDSQTVKTTEMVGDKGYDGGKKIKGRKRHIVVDTLGLLLAVAVTAANLDDGTHASEVLGKPRLKVILADNKYKNKVLDKWLASQGVPNTIEIVTKAAGTPGFVPVKIRWVVERAIAWLGRCRRLSKDYEYHTSSSETWVQIAAIQQMARRLRPDSKNRQASFRYPKKVKEAA